MLPPLFEYFAEVKVHGGNYLEKTYVCVYAFAFCKHLESLQCENVRPLYQAQNGASFCGNIFLRL